MADAEVEVPCRLRRTSSRGWGPWVEGRLVLPASATGPITFVTDDPADLTLVTGRAGRSAPLALTDPTGVARRPVRFKGEAFHGSDADIVVFTTDHNVAEIAVETADADGVHHRLSGG